MMNPSIVLFIVNVLIFVSAHAAPLDHESVVSLWARQWSGQHGGPGPYDYDDHHLSG
jgi:hypothetical protein